MARLGIAQSQPGSVRVSRTVSSPGGQYDDLTRVRYTELPTGGGSGHDYVVVVMGNAGRLFSSNPAARMVTRWGLRIGSTEIPETWSEMEHLGNPIYAQNSVDPPFLALPWQVCFLVRDWPTGVDLLLSAQHVAIGGQTFGFAEFDNVCVLVLDLTAFGGSRTAQGWFGSRVVVHQVHYPSGQILGNLGDGTFPSQMLSTSLLPWSSGTDTWLACWSQQMHPKSAAEPFQVWGISPGTDTWSPPFADWHGETRVRSRTVHTGGALAMDGSNVYQTGTFAPFAVTNATCSFRVLAASAYAAGSTQALARTAGGCLVAVRIDGLDGAFAQNTPGTILDAVGITPGLTGAQQQYQVDVPRDTRQWVALARVQTAETPNDVGGLVDAPLQACTVLQNGNGQRNAQTLLGSYRVIGANEKLPIQHGAATAEPRYAARGGNFVTVDYFAAAGARPPGVIQLRGEERCVAVFALRDDGPVADPAPVRYTPVVVSWDKEGPDISEIPSFVTEPSAIVATQFTGDHTQDLRTADGYLYRWGGPVSMRRLVTVSWPSLSRDELAAVHADVVDGDVRCRRWQPKDEFAEMVWAIVPGTFKPSAGDDGVFAAQVDLVELLWYGAP